MFTVRHNITFTNPPPPSDYEHFGDIVIQAGASLTVDLVNPNRYFIHRRSSMDVFGDLIFATGSYQFGRQWTSDMGFFHLHPSGTANFADDFFLNAETELLIDNTACDAFLVNGMFFLSGSEPLICGQGQLIVPDCQVFNNSASQVLLPQAQALDRLINTTVCDGFQFFESLADCQTGLPKITGNAAFSLPVEWLNFTAVGRNGQVFLNWQTGTEVNNSHFIVERSAEGETFEPVMTVQGAGTTLETTRYEAIDTQVGTKSVYYRLQQVDFDGTSSFSKQVKVVWANSTSQLQVVPNPLSEMQEGIQLHLNQWPVSEKISIEIMDAKGRRVYQKFSETSAEGALNAHLECRENWPVACMCFGFNHPLSNNMKG